MATVVLTSEKFPVGTSVAAYPSANRHIGGKPSGTATATAVVGASGNLTFTLAEGMYTLFAEVEGDRRTVALGNIAYTPPLPTLRERIARRQVENGVST